ncbi:GntP family permease [Parapedobacter sp. 10938]|uniref:GntP family permease n=1 Tax=Parapedobacter flavus TaxID=3110225 RepID=UPI002DBAA4D9|nr:GntP family permease [Parapedobacter sp. 10938]MEC3878908.1 GntP family permease [Parapedobacter sp. 10938]
MAIITILLSIAAIVLLITKLKLHPFLALLLVSIVTGLVSGMDPVGVVGAIQDGFGGTIGKIGLVIILGILIGAFLEKSGGAMVLANNMLALIGRKRVITAMGVIGYIISIPVFSDSAFVLLSSLNKSLTKRAGLSLAGTAIALGLGLSCTHALVPPTPGPIAAAGILDADLGIVMGLGMISAGMALVAALLFAHKVAAKVDLDPGEIEEEPDQVDTYRPSLFSASLPIFVPILLIVGKSLSVYMAAEGWQVYLGRFLDFFGEPVIALLVGFGCCLVLPKKLDKNMLSTDGWVNDALTDSATIIMVTGAGGIFGAVLQNSGIATTLGDMLTSSNLGILLPFLLAAALKSAQGSSTVALITAASVTAPLMGALGFVSELDKALVVIAIGAGSLVVSHVNDSFFWVLTQITKMEVKTGYKLHTMGTFIIGCTAMITVYFMFWLLH